MYLLFFGSRKAETKLEAKGCIAITHQSFLRLTPNVYLGVSNSSLLLISYSDKLWKNVSRVFLEKKGDDLSFLFYLISHNYKPLMP